QCPADLMRIPGPAFLACFPGDERFFNVPLARAKEIKRALDHQEPQQEGRDHNPGQYRPAPLHVVADLLISRKKLMHCATAPYLWPCSAWTATMPALCSSRVCTMRRLM